MTRNKNKIQFLIQITSTSKLRTHLFKQARKKNIRHINQTFVPNSKPINKHVGIRRNSRERVISLY